MHINGMVVNLKGVNAYINKILPFLMQITYNLHDFLAFL